MEPVVGLLYFLLGASYLCIGAVVANGFVGEKISLVSIPRKILFLLFWPLLVIGVFVGLLIHTPDNKTGIDLTDDSKESLLDLVRLAANVLDLTHSSIPRRDLERAGYAAVDLPEAIHLLRAWILVLGYCNVSVKEDQAKEATEALGVLVRVVEERK